MKKVFLIDTENIGSYDFIDEYKFNENDEIVFFVSENSKKISLKELIRLDGCLAQRRMENVIVGTKNSLDFQLVVYMTREVVLHGSNIYIVSQDKGFEVAVDYIKKFYDVEVSLISGSKSITAMDSKSGLEIKDIVSDVMRNEEEWNRFFEVISKAPKTKRLSCVHNELVSSHGEEGRRLYGKVRPKLKSFYSEIDKATN